jgi:hypothetical protein
VGRTDGWMERPYRVVLLRPILRSSGASLSYYDITALHYVVGARTASRDAESPTNTHSDAAHHGEAALHSCGRDAGRGADETWRFQNQEDWRHERI